MWKAASGAIVFQMCLFISANVSGYQGTVTDGSTGQPVSGVWVIGRWELGGGLAHGAGGCMLAIDRTDSSGRFSLEGREGLLGKWFPLKERPAIQVYLAGRRETSASKNRSSDVFTIEPDLATVDDRLHKLVNLLGYADCGEQSISKHREALRSLYRAIDEECADIADTPRQKEVLKTTRRYREMVEKASNN